MNIVKHNNKNVIHSRWSVSKRQQMEQAWAELCQAQDKLSLVELN